MENGVRCRFSEQGLEVFEIQRLGFATEKNDQYGKGYKVLWDGLKTPQKYSADYIDASPSVALLSEEDIKKMTEITEPQVTQKNILDIEEKLQKILSTGLSEAAIVILLHDYIGSQKISKKQIKMVLETLPKLKQVYFK